MAPLFPAFERRLSVVPRWVIVPTIFKQDVAQHSFYVALYTDRLCRLLGWPAKDRAAAVAQALRHDMEEVMQGDIPGPAKKRIGVRKHVDQQALEEAFPEYREVSSAGPLAVSLVVKAADYLEAAMFMARELAVGNKNMHRIYARQCSEFAKAGRSCGLTSAQVDQILNDISLSAEVTPPL